jgi:uncharacterized membrane protein
MLELLAGGILFFFPFSLLFVAGGLLPEGMGWIGSVMILLYGALVFLSEVRATPIAVTLARALALGGGLFFLEWFGVTTGLPFGRYNYEDTLGFRVAGVPLAIAVAWYATLITGWRISRRLQGERGKPSAHAAGTAALTLGMDLVLEPFAAFVTSYWTWEGGTVPLENYLSWCGIAAAAGFVLSMTEGPTSERERHLLPVAVLVYGMQMILFSVTILARGFWLETSAALLLLGGLVLVTRRYRRREAV